MDLLTLVLSSIGVLIAFSILLVLLVIGIAPDSTVSKKLIIVFRKILNTTN